jgi:alkanesulfonate monooxygenase SsuD/methylene tetrahydromethanopterin reductase-like flavin-dependent oxidoreductase (luciferase family)
VLSRCTVTCASSSLDVLSGGRLIIGAAAGWLPEEFEALGVPFSQRGPRTDEAITLLRSCWHDRTVTHDGPIARLRDMRVEPRPGRDIPIWIGGTSSAALARAIRVGDGGG